MAKATNVVEEQDDDLFNPENRLQSGKFQWGKVGNVVKGTLVGITQAKYDDGKVGNVYELLVIHGKFNAITEDEQTGNIIVAEEETVLSSGDYVRVNGKDSIDKEMKKVKIGQIIGMRLESIGKKVAGKKPFKDVAVFPGKMNEEWIKEQNEGKPLDENGVPF